MDTERTKVLQRLGLRVIRVTNSDVTYRALEKVVRRRIEEIQQSARPAPPRRDCGEGVGG